MFFVIGVCILILGLVESEKIRGDLYCIVLILLLFFYFVQFNVGLERAYKAMAKGEKNPYVMKVVKNNDTIFVKTK